MPVNWDFESSVLLMQVGESFAVPALAPDPVRKKVLKIAKLVGVKLEWEMRIEDHHRCIRFWRVK